MPFGTQGDLLLILLILVVAFGAKKLPLLSGERAEGSPAPSSRWTRSDWLLLAATILAVSVAVALEIWKIRNTR